MHQSEKHRDYESVYDYRLLRRLPVIIRVQGSGFSKITRRLSKPYSLKLSGLITATMTELVKLVDGSIFGFSQSDEITIVSRNDWGEDTTPWMNNRIQAINSTIASNATYFFNNNSTGIDLAGPGIFRVNVFAVPTIEDAADNISNRQNECLKNAINECLILELSKKYDRKEISEILDGKTMDERVVLLERSGVNVDEFHRVYKFGVGCYRQRKSGSLKGKWVIDDCLPRFDADDFLLSILSKGYALEAGDEY